MNAASAGATALHRLFPGGGAVSTGSAYLLQRVHTHGCTLDQQRVDSWLEMDVELNVQGLEVWLDRVQR